MHLIEIFTDGSCHTQLKIGAWVAIVFVDNEKIILQGHETDTTHNRMELVGIIKAVEFIEAKFPDLKSIKVVTDSQYAVGLSARESKFIERNFHTRGGDEIQNADLVKRFLELRAIHNFDLEKIKAHQKESSIANYNIEADKLSRKIVREIVQKSIEN